jgi:hypothetical protein
VSGIVLIPGVEWILLHRHFTCKSENPRILAPLIILEQTLKYKSCRALKMVPNSSYALFFNILRDRSQPFDLPKFTYFAF